jgi:GNAT superfamily N-acetyltransferase
VRVLGSAFAYGDPVDEFIFPSDDVRLRRAPRMMRIMLLYRFLPVGGAEVATLDGRVVGAFLWYPIGYRKNAWREFVSGLRLLWVMGTAVSRGMAVDAAFERVAPEEPHLFGVYLGSDPKVQRSGVGRALFGSLMKKADTQSVPLYLMCKDGNVDYYRAFGSEVVGRTVLGSDGPELNVMARVPARVDA